uniref:Putative secreted protein n=1 Tax=Ixodes ricinus TaxID=34613 RepID=A0A0K8RLE4_IXORI
MRVASQQDTFILLFFVSFFLGCTGWMVETPSTKATPARTIARYIVHCVTAFAGLCVFTYVYLIPYPTPTSCPLGALPRAAVGGLPPCSWRRSAPSRYSESTCPERPVPGPQLCPSSGPRNMRPAGHRSPPLRPRAPSS